MTTLVTASGIRKQTVWTSVRRASITSIPARCIFDQSGAVSLGRVSGMTGSQKFWQGWLFDTRAGAAAIHGCREVDRNRYPPVLGMTYQSEPVITGYFPVLGGSPVHHRYIRGCLPTGVSPRVFHIPERSTKKFGQGVSHTRGSS